MRSIALFVEDEAHRKVIGALVTRLAAEQGAAVRLDWYTATGGHGRVVQRLARYLRDFRLEDGLRHDLIIVAVDANCQGAGKRKEFQHFDPPAPMLLAIPDPHIERWLLLDGAAFRKVLGKGCGAPDRKCQRDLYKDRLAQAMLASGNSPDFAGIDFAEALVGAMNLDRAARADASLNRFVDELRAVLREW